MKKKNGLFRKKKSRRRIIAETPLTTLRANKTNCGYNQFEKC